MGAPKDRVDTQAFFAARAATWDERFPNDEPAFRRAAAEMTLTPGSRVLDVGCGTGRVLGVLRDAAGAGGGVIGLDVTIEMCRVAARRGAVAQADLLAGLPLPDASVDAVFGAGLVPHLTDVPAGLLELARVTRPGGTLALFHPLGRVALAARRGHELHPDDPRDPVNLPPRLEPAGWRLLAVHDDPDRYLALASRV